MVFIEGLIVEQPIRRHMIGYRDFCSASPSLRDRAPAYVVAAGEFGKGCALSSYPLRVADQSDEPNPHILCRVMLAAVKSSAG
jgi:hypothetical protein